jgi:hypothetical protein
MTTILIIVVVLLLFGGGGYYGFRGRGNSGLCFVVDSRVVDIGVWVFPFVGRCVGGPTLAFAR